MRITRFTASSNVIPCIRRSSGAFGIASFSLYLDSLYHFSFVIKGKKSKSRNSKTDLPVPIQKAAQLAPTTLELALIAAQLVQLPSENTKPFSFIAHLALEMWDACEKIRWDRVNTIKAAMDLNSPENRALLKKTISFPVSLDDFLILRMPKKKRANRSHIYQEFVRHSIRHFDYVRAYLPNGKSFEEVPIPDDKRVEACIERERSEGFSPASYAKTSETFLQWLTAYEARNRRERASKGGQVVKAKRGEK